MKKKIVFSLGAIIILIILGSVFFFPRKIEHGMQNSNKKVTITKQENGKEVSVKEGDIIQIELEENGSTGYIWQIDNLDKSYFELLSEDTRKTTTDNNLVGVPVVGIWQIKVLKQGAPSIKMDYYRPWEGRESAIDHFVLNLRVN
jgi:inhibitor of cysteine peptidase